MRVVVQQVTVPAYVSIGFGEGFDDEGNYIHFVGDHRPMRCIAEALAAGEEVEVEIEWYQIQRIERSGASA